VNQFATEKLIEDMFYRLFLATILNIDPGLNRLPKKSLETISVLHLSVPETCYGGESDHWFWRRMTDLYVECTVANPTTKINNNPQISRIAVS